jgi:hypothetical protein
LTGLALAHGYDTAFWWTAGIFAVGAVIGGALLRRGPLGPRRTPAPADDQVTTAQAKAGPGLDLGRHHLALVIPSYFLRAEGASRPRARARSTASWRLWTPNLAYRWRVWVPTVFTETNSSLAISCAVRWVGR